MKAQNLKNSILQLAMQGKLVSQSSNDEPASILLNNIKKEKGQLIKSKKIKRNNKESTIYKENEHYFEKIGKNGEPICIDDEIPFDIPDTWMFCRLDNIIYTTPTKKYQIKKTEILQTGEIPVISQSKEFIEGYSNYQEKILEISNPVIIFGDHTKNVKYVDFDFIVGADGVKILNPILIYPKFLYYLLMYSKINMNDRGYSRHYQFLKEIYYPIPPLNEQIRIVVKIEEILPLIDEYGNDEEQLTQLNSEFPDKLRSSILYEAVQGKLILQDPNDESASILLGNIKKEKGQLIKSKKIKRNNKESTIYKENEHYYEKIGKNGEPICIDDEIPFDIPDTWEWCRLNSICEYIQRGKSPKYSQIKKYPVISQKCNQWDGLYLDEAKFIDPDSLDSYKEERILQDNDLLWNSTGTGTLGRIGLYDASINNYGWAVADGHITVVRPFKKWIIPKFIYYYLANPTVQFVIESEASGTTNQIELNLSTVKNYLIPLPPTNEQKRIINKIEVLFDVIDVSIFRD